MEYLIAAIPSVISAIALAIAGWVAKIVFVKGKALIDLVLQIAKVLVQFLYEDSINKGEVSPMRLESLTRLYESYNVAGGNTYVDILVKKLEDLPLNGEPVPVHSDRR